MENGLDFISLNISVLVVLSRGGSRPESPTVLLRTRSSGLARADLGGRVRPLPWLI